MRTEGKASELVDQQKYPTREKKGRKKKMNYWNNIKKPLTYR